MGRLPDGASPRWGVSTSSSPNLAYMEFMKAAVFHPPHEIKIEDRPIPKIGPGEILMKVLACGVCGTDVLKISRSLPKEPIVLGHELVGKVMEVGEGVARIQREDRVVVAHHVPCGHCHYCLRDNPSMCRKFKTTNLDPGGFSQYLRIPPQHVERVTFRVPDSLSDDEVIFTEPLACCVRNVRRAGLLPGDFAVVVGMGSIGLMMIQLLKLLPITVLATDLKPERLELAKKLGADHVLLGNDSQIPATIQEHTQNRGADVVMFTAGSGRIFQEAVSWVRDGGRLNLFATLSEKPVEVNLDTLYHHEITVFSSYSPSPEDLVEAHRLLVEGKIRVKPLVSHHLKLEELQKGIDLLVKQEAMKVIINP